MAGWTLTDRALQAHGPHQSLDRAPGDAMAVAAQPEMTKSAYAITFYVKSNDMTPATVANKTVWTRLASSSWMAREAAREALCAEYPSGMGGSMAVILDVEKVAA